MAPNKLTSYIKVTGLIMIGLLAITSSSLAADDKWERKENMPESSRCCTAAASVGGKVYVIGWHRSQPSTAHFQTPVT